MFGFFFLPFYGHTCSIWKFPGHRFNRSHSCSNPESFNPLCHARDQTHTSIATHSTQVEFLPDCAMAGTLVPYTLEALLTFGKSPFLSFFPIGNTQLSIFRFPLYHLHYIYEPILGYFISVIVYFICKISI